MRGRPDSVDALARAVRKDGAGGAILFAGAIGTGKRMAAEALAGQLELERYRIDLSAIVSKYIGETEKNIDRIFADAERSGAVLLIDEADSLFGKRSEVRDAHDRYANVEVGYLLQKMEEFSGIAILTPTVARTRTRATARRGASGSVFSVNTF